MPTTTSKLSAFLFMVWAGIPFINHLIHSMDRGCQNLVYVESTYNPITSALADVLKDDWSKFKAYTDSTPHYDVWFSP
jgi:TM2 domain-containing membrane protein YozV